MQHNLPVVRIVHFYKSYFQNDSLTDLLRKEGFEIKQFSFFETPGEKKRIHSKSRVLILEIICLYKVLINFSKFRNETVVCFGGHYAFFIITKIGGFLLGKRYRLHVYNFYLHDLGRNPLVKIFLRIFLRSPRITLIVQSPQELNYYSKYVKTEIQFVPFCIAPEINMGTSPLKFKNYLFSGGYSNRDYDLLIKSIKQNPEINFVIVASSLNKDLNRLPSNVVLIKDTDNMTFNAILDGADGVIIPLKKDVGASGQIVSLLAMKMRKPAVYCDISAINYYFESYKTGIPYKIGDLESLNKAIKILQDPNFNKSKMSQDSYRRFLNHFTIEKRDEQLIDIIKKTSFVS